MKSTTRSLWTGFFHVLTIVHILLHLMSLRSVTAEITEAVQRSTPGDTLVPTSSLIHGQHCSTQYSSPTHEGPQSPLRSSVKLQHDIIADGAIMPKLGDQPCKDITRRGSKKERKLQGHPISTTLPWINNITDRLRILISSRSTLRPALRLFPKASFRNLE
ncbi:unnamed protein product [Calypogeia fissa]